MIFGLGFQEVFVLLLLVGIILLVILAISKGGRNYPTWTGIIVSAILGLLAIYLVLCFFGLMGEERNSNYQ
jgi:hypothetical protein